MNFLTTSWNKEQYHKSDEIRSVGDGKCLATWRDERGCKYHVETEKLGRNRANGRCNNDVYLLKRDRERMAGFYATPCHYLVSLSVTLLCSLVAIIVSQGCGFAVARATVEKSSATPSTVSSSSSTYLTENSNMQPCYSIRSLYHLDKFYTGMEEALESNRLVQAVAMVSCPRPFTYMFSRHHLIVVSVLTGKANQQMLLTSRSGDG